MGKIQLIIAVIITVLMCDTEAYAKEFRRTSADSGDPVIGQVTITNVDGADNAKTLNGAHIRIVNKDTSEEYTNMIEDNGSLVFQLPLGSYTLTQVLAPNDYQLNTKAYEFTLQVPEGADFSNIKIVNASVTMTNDLITAEAAPEPAAGAPNAPETAQPEQNFAPEEFTTEGYIADSPVMEFISTAEKNPVTADKSNKLLAIAVLSFIIMVAGFISRKCLINRLF